MSFLTYDKADDIITSLEIIEKLLFTEIDFWRNNCLKGKNAAQAAKKLRDVYVEEALKDRQDFRELFSKVYSKKDSQKLNTFNLIPIKLFNILSCILIYKLLNFLKSRFILNSIKLF